MTMEYKALDDGGDSWEWQVRGLRFQAVVLDGSPVVTLYYREADHPEAFWEYSHNREIEGREARTVAEEMFRDTAEAPMNITARLRIKRSWYIAFGEYEGKYGVGLEVLYVTHGELKELREALGEVD
jgi:hypothetical protein